MKFERTIFDGLWIVEIESAVDERGSFARTFCADEFAAHGLQTAWAQTNISRNSLRGTLRGLHFQSGPQPEVKLIRCTAGAIFDVVVDVRRDSPTFGRWQGFELTATSGRALHVPGGFAHGIQAITDDAEVSYMMSTAYDPGLARGIRWDDPAVGIKWPLLPIAISPRDRALPLLAELA
ncbi:MAG: dTDP-4-dehydrorhamnose 3,5-epimerase [Chthoniobacteraceae bacterium]